MNVDWLASALEGTGWTVEQVLDGVEKGDFHLFQNDKALAVMEFIVSPRHKVAHVWAAGGDKNKGGLQAYRKLVPIMEEFGRSSGCGIAGGTFGEGRQGWVRAMRDMGYSVSEMAVEKEL